MSGRAAITAAASVAKLVGVVGRAGAGKDTVAELLIKEGFTRLTFGAAIKDTCAAIFQWDREKLEGLTPASRAWREAEDPWWAEKLGRPGFSPRVALQVVGTDLLRTHLHPDVWVMSLQRRLENALEAGQRVVVSDVRFPGEMDLLRRLGGKIVIVERGSEAENAARDAGAHASEVAWKAGVRPGEDALLRNDGTIEELHSSVAAALGLRPR